MFALIFDVFCNILATMVLLIAIYWMVKPADQHISRDSHERKKLRKIKKES